MTLEAAVMQAIAESIDDLMLNLPCRCGCGSSPVSDHYLPAGLLEALRLLAEELPNDLH